MLYIHAECMILIELMKIMTFLDHSIHCKIKIKQKMLQKTWFFKILLNDFRSVFWKVYQKSWNLRFFKQNFVKSAKEYSISSFFKTFLKKNKKWKHTYKPNVFCMISMKINVWSGCCYSQIHVLKTKLFRKHSEHPNNFVDFIQKNKILKKKHFFGQF